MATCNANTAAGNPCKNHVVKGTELCKALGGTALSIRHGALPGNTNAVKHGFYRNVISDEKYARLIAYAVQILLNRRLHFQRHQHGRLLLRSLSLHIQERAINIANIQLRQLAHPQPMCQQQQDNRPIALSRFRVWFNTPQQRQIPIIGRPKPTRSKPCPSKK